MPGCFRHTTSQTQKKSVTFCETVHITVVMPRCEYTSQEIQKCYFSREYHDNMNLWLVAVGEGMAVEDTRGLEPFLPGSEQDNALREWHVDAVMDEQERQDEEGIEDELLIAACCRRTSAKGAVRAFITGKRDERAAFGAYMKLQSDYSLMCVAPSPTSMDKATIRSYFATADIDKLSTNLLVTPAA